MTAISPPAPAALRAIDRRHIGPVLDVAVPVHNEQADLAPCVRRLHGYLRRHLPYDFVITIVDNASTDATRPLAERLAQQLDHVRVLHLPQRGRGRALHWAWTHSPAPVLAYVDVDLSTDLAALLPLVAPLISGHSDLAIGTRLGRGARVVRGAKRELISRSYNLILRGTLAAQFSDAQCGFKAIRREAALELLPLVRDQDWFFDTELLVLAQRAGLRIHEVPVDWVDDPDSRVDIVATAVADLKGVWRLGRGLATGPLPLAEIRRQLGRGEPTVPGAPRTLGRHLVRFAAIGAASTLAYLVLYALARNALPAQAANVVALLATAVGNTAANRRLTFGVRGRDRAVRHQFHGLAVFALGLALTAGALALIHRELPAPSREREYLALVVANAVTTSVRFLLLRRWVFRPASARA
jgi:putative flippase GtrA